MLCGVAPTSPSMSAACTSTCRMQPEAANRLTKDHEAAIWMQHQKVLARLQRQYALHKEE
jgi:hypothetical protein